MAERMVLVPESQIERAARLLIASGFNQMGGELRMLLQQPPVMSDLDVIEEQLQQTLLERGKKNGAAE